MQCVGWIVQSLAEQPVVGLIQQLLKEQYWLERLTHFRGASSEVLNCSVPDQH